MPRGNIETVEPRLLLFAKLAQILNAKSIDWKIAFKLCRRQRVNLNLLVDHNGVNNFSVTDFFDQLVSNGTKDEIAAFNTFLFELEDQNCTSKNGLYFDIYNRDEISPKVKIICNKISGLIESNPDRVSSQLSVYLHCQLKVNGMGKTLLALSHLLKKNIAEDQIKSGIKFLAVMQQEWE